MTAANGLDWRTHLEEQYALLRAQEALDRKAVIGPINGNAVKFDPAEAGFTLREPEAPVPKPPRRWNCLCRSCQTRFMADGPGRKQCEVCRTGRPPLRQPRTRKFPGLLQPGEVERAMAALLRLGITAIEVTSWDGGKLYRQWRSDTGGEATLQVLPNRKIGFVCGGVTIEWGQT